VGIEQDLSTPNVRSYLYKNSQSIHDWLSEKLDVS